MVLYCALQQRWRLPRGWGVLLWRAVSPHHCSGGASTHEQACCIGHCKERKAGRTMCRKKVKYLPQGYECFECFMGILWIKNNAGAHLNIALVARSFSRSVYLHARNLPVAVTGAGLEDGQCSLAVEAASSEVVYQGHARPLLQQRKLQGWGGGRERSRQGRRGN